ncbi:MAG: hypothetical protein ACNS62_07330 [Candidatus Cyclobacteriaceae bacterium M3_2C_046]
MINIYSFIFILIFTITATIAQDKSNPIQIKISGFVRTDFMLDTRQVVSAREGQFLLFPQNVKLDENGKDINARANFNYLAILSRAKLTATGPDILNAKSTAVLEGDFFGQQDFFISGFRLRNAIVKLNWDNWEILTGRYWHPMFGVKYYPKTVSFNTGVPFMWLSRNGQIRITRQAGKFEILGAVVTQRDFASPGGPDALRNALLPDLQGRISYEPSEQLLMGISAGYKQLLPRLETDSGFVTRSMVRGFTSNLFMKYSPEKYTFTLYGSLLQNGYDGLALGGYAVQEITNVPQNQLDYTTLNTSSAWAEIYTNSQPWEVGLFAGYTQNLGSQQDIENASSLGQFSRGANISHVYRLSPRLVYKNQNLQVGTELEYTTAAYGNAFNEQGIPLETKDVTNLRILVSVAYFY